MFISVEDVRYQILILSKPLHEFDPAQHRGFCDESRRLIYISALELPAAREKILRHEAVHAWEFCYGPPADDEEHRANWNSTMSASLERQIAKQGGWARLMALRPDDVEEAPPAAALADSDDEEASVPQDESDAPSMRLPSDLAILTQWKQRREAARDAMPSPSSGRRHVPGPLQSERIAAPPSIDFEGIRFCGKCNSQVAGTQVHNAPVKMGILGPQIQRTIWCDFCQHLMSWLEAADHNGKPGGAPVALNPIYQKGAAAESWLAKHPEMRSLEC